MPHGYLFYVKGDSYVTMVHRAMYFRPSMGREAMVILKSAVGGTACRETCAGRPRQRMMRGV